MTGKFPRSSSKNSVGFCSMRASVRQVQYRTSRYSRVTQTA